MIRILDFFLSLIGLLLLSPIFILISFAIIVESSGSFFFLQERVGKNGVKFKLFKFRSMFVDSEKKSLLTVGCSDPRITRVGRFIRKYKLDELPQLINVLIGDMSFVGPRPEVEKYVNLYTDEQRRILSVKPGITDYASIYYSNENEILADKENYEEYYINVLIPEKIQYNFLFVDNYTVKNYFVIIVKTLIRIIIN